MPISFPDSFTLASAAFGDSQGGGFLAGGLIGHLLFGQPFTGPNLADVLFFVGVGLLLYRALGLGRGNRDSSRDMRPDRDARDGEKPRPPIQLRPPRRPPASENDDDEITPREASERYRRAQQTWDHLSSTREPRRASPPPPVRGVPVPNDAPSPETAVETFDGAPRGFDMRDFLEGAKVFYVRFHDSWDMRDLDDLVQFTSPDMYRGLQEKAKQDPTRSTSSILMLDARPVDVRQEGEHTVAQVAYDALIQTNEAQEPKQVREVWRFSRDESRPKATWRLEAVERVQ